MTAATSTPLSTSLKPYPEYKDSGLPWLGKVPGHWQTAPGFAAFREKQVKNIGLKEKRVLSLSYGRIVVKPEGLRGLMPDSFETYQIVEPGDIIIRSTDLQNDKTSLRIGIVRDHGIITSAYICMKITEAVLPEFGYQLLNTYDLCKVLYGMGSGLRQNLAWSDFKRMPVFLPIPEEQAAIVRFLDHATHRLDKAIRAKRKTIALLNEQKQAIIHRAVTRGLIPDVPLKDSGIPWLGQIPAHWEVCRLGRLAKILNGTTPSRAKPAYWSNGTIPWLASGKVNDGLVTKPSELITTRALDECSLTLIPSGALIMGMIGQGRTRGMCALLSIDACINQNLAAIVSGPLLFNLFLLNTLIACYYDVREFGRGGNQAALNCEIVGRLPVPVLPIKEQQAICRFIQDETSSLNAAISRFEREIDLLREYRTRLIADVVTGKLDVREAAARLPEVEGAPAVEPDLAELEESGEELAEENI